MQQQGDLRPDPAELQDPATEDELDWEGDPDDLLSVLVEVKPETPEHS